MKKIGSRKNGGKTTGWERLAFALVMATLLFAARPGVVKLAAASSQDASKVDQIICDTLEATPLPPGLTKKVHFVPSIPLFTVTQTWRDSEGRTHEQVENLLTESTACGVDYDHPLWTEPLCQIANLLPNPSMPDMGRYLTQWSCGTGNERVNGSVSITLGMPSSAFHCNVGTPEGPITRAVFLQGCQRAP